MLNITSHVKQSKIQNPYLNLEGLILYNPAPWYLSNLPDYLFLAFSKNTSNTTLHHYNFTQIQLYTSLHHYLCLSTLCSTHTRSLRSIAFFPKVSCPSGFPLSPYHIILQLLYIKSFFFCTYHGLKSTNISFCSMVIPPLKGKLYNFRTLSLGSRAFSPNNE